MLDKKTIEHLAKLSNLDLAEKQQKKFTEQLNSILVYFRQIQELDLKKVKTTDHITGLQNNVRADEVRQLADQDAILNAAPEIEKKQIKVKPVLKK